jgi:hypothetical protein
MTPQSWEVGPNLGPAEWEVESLTLTNVHLGTGGIQWDGSLRTT